MIPIRGCFTLLFPNLGNNFWCNYTSACFLKTQGVIYILIQTLELDSEIEYLDKLFKAMDECIWESRCCLIDLLFLSHCLFSEIKAKDHLLKIGAPPVAIEISNASLWERLHRISKVRLASEKWAILVYWKSWGLWFMMTSHFASFPGPNSKGKKAK